VIVATKSIEVKFVEETKTLEEQQSSTSKSIRKCENRFVSDCHLTKMQQLRGLSSSQCPTNVAKLVSDFAGIVPTCIESYPRAVLH